MAQPPLLSFRNAKMKRRVQRACKRSGLTESDLLEGGLEEYLEKYDTPEKLIAAKMARLAKRSKTSSRAE